MRKPSGSTKPKDTDPSTLKAEVGKDIDQSMNVKAPVPDQITPDWLKFPS